MRSAWIIAKRELYAYLASPIAYLVAAAYLFLCGLFFIGGVVSWREASMQAVHGSLGIVLIFVAPVLTMRLLAREQDLGTIELLLTAPVRSWEVALGKFLAAFLFYAAMTAVTGLHVLILIAFGNPDVGTLASSYLGVLLLGAAMLSVGLFTSALTKNQVIAAVLGVVGCVGLWLIDLLSNLFTGPARQVLSYLTPSGHYYNLLQGLIDTRDLVYYLSFTVLLIFLTAQVIDARRWQG